MRCNTSEESTHACSFTWHLGLATQFLEPTCITAERYQESNHRTGTRTTASSVKLCKTFNYSLEEQMWLATTCSCVFFSNRAKSKVPRTRKVLPWVYGSCTSARNISKSCHSSAQRVPKKVVCCGATSSSARAKQGSSLTTLPPCSCGQWHSPVQHSAG